MKLDRKEIVIGAGVAIGAGLLYLRGRDKPIEGVPAADNVPVSRASNSYDASQGPGGGGSSPYTYTPTGLVPVAAVAPAPETSPVTVPVGDSTYDSGTSTDAGTVYDPPPAPDPAPAPVPDASPPGTATGPPVTFSSPLPAGYSSGAPAAGWPYPNFNLLLGNLLGYKIVSSGNNSNGAYWTIQFYSATGYVGQWNYYVSGSAAGKWVGPFNVRYAPGG